MVSTGSIGNLPPELLDHVFQYLSDRAILNLPGSLRVKGLSSAAARSRFSCFKITLTKHSLETLCCISKCPVLAPAVTKLTIQTERPRESDRDDYINWQLRNHLQSIESEESTAKCEDELQKIPSRELTMACIHRALGLERWSDCRVCSGGPPEHTEKKLAHAAAEQQELESSETDVNSLSHALRHLPNLKAVIIDNRSRCRNPLPRNRCWVNPRCSSGAHSLAVLFEALAAVGPTSVSISTLSTTRPRITQRTQPVPILLSDLLSEVSTATMSSALANIPSLELGSLKFSQHESQIAAAHKDDPHAEPEIEAPTIALTESLQAAKHLQTLFLGCTSLYRSEPFQHPGHLHLLPTPASTHPFRHLESLSLVNFWFHAHHLRVFLRACPSLLQLQLEDITLRSGTWYAVFRALRGAHAGLEELRLSYFERAPHHMLANQAGTASAGVIPELKRWLRGEVDEIPIASDFELPRETD